MAGAVIPTSIVAPASPPAQPAPAPNPVAVGRLLRELAGPANYERALLDARAQGGAVHDYLLRRGAVDPAAYAAGLARCLGVERLHWAPHLEPYAVVAATRSTLRELRARWNGREVRVLDAASGPPEDIAARVAALRAEGARPLLADARVYEWAVEHLHRAPRIREAVNGLRERAPLSSAAAGMRGWQRLGPVIAVGLLLGGSAVQPEATIVFATGLMALPFLCVTLLRGLALPEVLAHPRKRARRRRGYAAQQPLPFYSVLVPLFQEAAVLPDLVAALTAIDYPRERLEIFLLIETVDIETQAALLALALPAHFRVLQVPDCEPRTKPKALNYALQFVRGSMVVVYDAEDRPQPNQLRQAVEAFARSPATLGCAQARLNIYNPGQSWISRQFTIEYSMLFDAILPTLERLRLPVPLGGTSNHFRRETLQRIDAWDPFNVTEDADLGIRLARLGYTTAVLPSTTWEEAPTTLGVWMRQRTRWVKGWMQTWLVHTRDMGALHRELGAKGAIGFHATFAGLVLSALMQPLCFMLLAYQVWMGDVFAPAEHALHIAVLWVALGNLAVGYVVSMLVGIISVWRRGRPLLGLHALLLPLYWLLISLAAYRALWQLVRSPFLWEKTPHGAARPRRTRR